MCCRFLGRIRQLRISFLNFVQCAGFQLIDEIVCLYSQTLSATHLNVRALTIFVRQFDSQLVASRGRQCNHLVTEMHAGILSDLWNKCSHSAGDDLLRIRLSRVDDVVDSFTAAKVRTFNRKLFFGGALCRCYPKWMAISVFTKDLVV